MHLVKLIFGAIAILSSTGSALYRNVTVDDSDPALVYSAGWNNQSCAGCVARKPGAAYDNTWHDGNQKADGHLTATLVFSGKATLPQIVSMNLICLITSIFPPCRYSSLCLRNRCPRGRSTEQHRLGHIFGWRFECEFPIYTLFIRGLHI
jgi:hypothetical protein